MRTVEIKENVFWVGAIDWDVRDFHGYSTEKGTTYNSFLVRDEKTALFDTVKKPFGGELLDRIRKITSPEKIDYLVVNHVEMDHSGSLPEVIEEVKPEKVYCSAMGKKALLEHFHRPDWPYEVVKTGDSISLGRKSVKFIETRMLHWPDSMFSYIPEDRLLISSDAFGQHWATSERFDDEVDAGELMAHAAKYYANILLLYSSFAQKLLEEVRALNLAIDMIAPDHGLIWRSRPQEILEAYARWARQETMPKAVIVYDTMYKSTEAMARAVYSGLFEEGVNVRMMDLKVNHRSQVMTEILDARAILLGASTLNNNLLPRMADMLTYMKGLRPANRIGAAFGSYGWSGEAVKQITQALEEMKFEVMDPGIRVRYVPTEEDLTKCTELGRKIGAAVKQGGRSS
jgi:flavorubredoxin